MKKRELVYKTKPSGQLASYYGKLNNHIEGAGGAEGSPDYQFVEAVNYQIMCGSCKLSDLVRMIFIAEENLCWWIKTHW